MYIVTGGAGFIGSNIVHGLNRHGVDDIIVVDDLSEGDKVANLAGASFVDYLDKDEFIDRVMADDDFAEEIYAIFHQGACSDTMELDGQYMMAINYSYSKTLLHYAASRGIPFIYASSASVYGGNTEFSEHKDNEHPINPYAFSKYAFDLHVRKVLPSITSQVIGMRYFNVYGPRESHKGRMASVVFHFNHQLKTEDTLRLFKGSGGYDDGEQRRDFIYVEDVVNFNLWCLTHPEARGIVNVGTANASSFNQVANAVIEWHGRGAIEYIDFPEQLEGRYQHFTEAKIEALRALGYEKPFTAIEDGVKQYLDWLNSATS